MRRTNVRFNCIAVGGSHRASRPRALINDTPAWLLLRKEKKEHLWTGKSLVFSPSWPQWRDDPQWTTYRQTRQKIKSRPRWGLRRQHVSLPYLCLSIVYQKWLILQQLEKIKIMSQVSPSTLRSKNDDSICFMNVKSTRQVQFCLFRSGLSQLGLPALSLYSKRWFICH